MSESYGSVSTTSSDASTGTHGTAETAKHEAAQVKDTAAAEAGNVVETAKAEAGNVAAEAKSQAKQLYAQTRSELQDQAHVQQQRAAAGLSAIGDELRALASGEAPQSTGLATDLVREASTRVSSLASWLGDRDPGTLLNDVKAYARRKPGTFITLAAVAGIVVGRLGRALAENKADEKAQQELTTSPTYAGVQPVANGFHAAATVPPTGTDSLADTPLYAERSASLPGGVAQEGAVDDRPDSF